MGGQGQETRKDSGLSLWKEGRCPGSCHQEGSESQSCGQGPLVSRGWRLAYYLCLKDSTRLSAAPEGQLLGSSGEKILQHSWEIYTGVAALAGSIHVGGIRVAGMGKEEHGRGHMFVAHSEYTSNNAWGEIFGCDSEGPQRSRITQKG